MIILAHALQTFAVERNVVNEMAAPAAPIEPRFCLACGKATQPNDRRLLCSEASSNVCKVWDELLAERLKERHAEVDVNSVMKDGCVCKKCFMAMKVFYDRKLQLLRNLDGAIENIPSSAITFVTELETRQSRKRACDFSYDRSAKHPRLNTTSSSTASPRVEVYKIMGTNKYINFTLHCCRSL